jgi:hypothetical protein
MGLVPGFLIIGEAFCLKRIIAENLPWRTPVNFRPSSDKPKLPQNNAPGFDRTRRYKSGEAATAELRLHLQRITGE